MSEPTIKGLVEKCGTTEEDIERLRELRISTGMQMLAQRALIIQRGGNIHRIDHKATAKRRKANKAARKARRARR